MTSRLSRYLRIEPERGPSPSAFASASLEAADFETLAVRQELGHDPPLAARDEAVFLLHTAAEVEHALMVQYLYAAYSLDGPQVPQDKVPLVRSWKRDILDIAREEMGHLASVQNLLRFVGGTLNLEREDFPFRTGLYPFRFRLERLTKNSLAKYVYAEMPEELAGPDIDKIRERAIGSNADAVNHVGRLYRSIASLFARREPDGTFSLKDSDLQAEPIGLQAGEEWTFFRDNLIVRQVKTRDGAQDGAIPLIRDIAVQGEGMPATGNLQGSHYQKFRAIYDVFPEEDDWQPSRLVPEDPNTTERDPAPLPGPDADAEERARQGRITHPRSRLWAQLLNLRYRMLLTNIFHTLHLDGPVDTDPNTRDPKSRLLIWVHSEMTPNIRSIAGFLVGMPQRRGDAAGPPFAGPTFELPYTLSLADSEPNRWRLHRDLLLTSQTLVQKIQPLETDPTSDPAKFLMGLSQRDAADLLFAQAQISPAPVPLADVVALEAASLMPAAAMRFTEVKEILEEAVSGDDIGAHGNFWRNKTRDQFVAHKVFGQALLLKRADGTFDENESNLVKALEGRNPFGNDIGTPGATFRRMPAGLNPVAAEKVEVIRQWIRDGCPDDAP